MLRTVKLRLEIDAPEELIDELQGLLEQAGYAVLAQLHARYTLTASRRFCDVVPCPPPPAPPVWRVYEVQGAGKVALGEFSSPGAARRLCQQYPPRTTVIEHPEGSWS